MLQPPFYLPSKMRMFWVIHLHPSHQLFSQLRNHSTVSLTIPLGDLVFFGAYFDQFSWSSLDVNKNKRKNYWADVCSHLRTLLRKCLHLGPSWESAYTWGPSWESAYTWGPSWESAYTWDPPEKVLTLGGSPKKVLTLLRKCLHLGPSRESAYTWGPSRESEFTNVLLVVI